MAVSPKYPKIKQLTLHGAVQMGALIVTGTTINKVLHKNLESMEWMSDGVLLSLKVKGKVAKAIIPHANIKIALLEEDE